MLEIGIEPLENFASAAAITEASTCPKQKRKLVHRYRCKVVHPAIQRAEDEWRRTPPPPEEIVVPEPPALSEEDEL